MKILKKTAVLFLLNIIILIFAGIVLIVVISNAAPESRAKPLFQAEGLPAHELRLTTLPSHNGPIVDIIVTRTDFTMKKCRDLIAEYRHLTNSEGQVAVYKPRYELGGPLSPWCIDMMDGGEIIFNY